MHKNLKWGGSRECSKRCWTTDYILLLKIHCELVFNAPQITGSTGALFEYKHVTEAGKSSSPNFLLGCFLEKANVLNSGRSIHVCNFLSAIQQIVGIVWKNFKSDCVIITGAYQFCYKFFKINITLTHPKMVIFFSTIITDMDMTDFVGNFLNELKQPFLPQSLLLF